jgi:large subunit ribosomal protein L6
MYERQVEIPEIVKLELEGMTVKVSGEKGTLERTFKGFFGIKMEKSGNALKVRSESDKRKQRAVVGAIIAHVKNMIKGVTDGYTANLKIIYSHFPVTVKVEGKKVIVNNFLGEKTPRESKIFGDDTKVEVKGADIVVSGTDIEAVGQTAAYMEQTTRIKEHDRKIFQDGIYITKKPNQKE